VQVNIENNRAERSVKKIENHCKTIATFGKNYKRKKSLVVQYQSGWLKKKESISIKRPHCKSNQIEDSAHRGRPKLES